MDERISHFPPKQETESAATTRIGVLGVTGVYVGIMVGLCSLGASKSLSMRNLAAKLSATRGL